MKQKRKSQSITEYIMLGFIAIAGVATMTVYIQRAMDGRFDQVSKELWYPEGEGGGEEAVSSPDVPD